MVKTMAEAMVYSMRVLMGSISGVFGTPSAEENGHAEE